MGTDHHKATIQIGEKSVTFEGPRDFVETQVARYLEASSNSQEENVDQAFDMPTSSGGLRQLVAAKRPSGHPETVAVLAFGLAANGMSDFTEADMRRAYIQAGVRPPKVVAQALRDAKNNRDYIETTKKRGVYRLSPHGDRTVRFDLPRS